MLASVDYLLSRRHIPYKRPIAARIDLNISHVLLRDDHVCLIPEGKHRNIAADNFLNLRIKLSRLLAVYGNSSFLQQRIELAVAITTAILRRARFGRYLRGGKKIFIEDRILITSDPLAISDLKMPAAQLIKVGIGLGCLN